MSMVTKIITETQAQEFVEFATKEFKSVETLRDWLKPITDTLGVISQAEFTVIFCIHICECVAKLLHQQI